MSNAKVRSRRRRRAATAIPFPTPWKARPVDPRRAAEARRLIEELATIPVDPSPYRQDPRDAAYGPGWEDITPP